jgi:hypothetical protein
MLLAAADELSIDLTSSWAIGNSDRDIQAGLKAGCKTILVSQPHKPTITEQSVPKPHFTAVNMKEAVNIIKKSLRESKENLPQTGTTKPAGQQGCAEHVTDATPQNTKKNNKSESSERIESLLQNVVDQLKAMKRQNMFTEFSAMRLLAGIVQIFVLFCLILSIWFLMSPNATQGSVSIALSFAIVLQLMALTFYIMRGRKQ